MVSLAGFKSTLTVTTIAIATVTANNTAATITTTDHTDIITIATNIIAAFAKNWLLKQLD